MTIIYIYWPHCRRRLTGNRWLTALCLNRSAERTKFVLRVFDIGPGRMKRGLAYHRIRIFRVLRAAIGISRAAKRNAIIYTVLESGAGRFYNLLIFLLARIRRIELIIHHHTAEHVLSYDFCFWLLAKIAGSRSTHIVLSQKMKAELVARYKCIHKDSSTTQRCHYIHTTRSRLVGECFPHIRLGFLSNHSHAKGIDVALASLQRHGVWR